MTDLDKLAKGLTALDCERITGWQGPLGAVARTAGDRRVKEGTLIGKCVACAGKGFRWGRGRTGEAHMVKRKCGYCKGSGKAPHALP